MIQLFTMNDYNRVYQLWSSISCDTIGWRKRTDLNYYNISFKEDNE